jgi:ankyrin repeat protein
MLDKEEKEKIDEAVKSAQIPDNLLDEPEALNYALHSAVRVQNSELVERLLKKNAEVEAYDDEGFPPLHVAVRCSSAKIARLLCEHGANVNAKDNTPSEATPLHWALTNKDIRVIRFLLNRGADVNITGRGGYSALHRLIHLHNEDHCSEEWLSKELEIMSLLLEHGANPNATSTQAGCEPETLLSSAMDMSASRTNDRRNKMTKLIMLHIVLDNQDVVKPDRVTNSTQLSQLWDSYLTEIEALRNKNIARGCAYYDFCKADIDELVKDVPKRDLNAFKEKELENQFVNFPNFSNLLQNKLQKLKERDDILEKAKGSIVEEGEEKLNYDAQEKILESLSTKDLYSFYKGSRTSSTEKNDSSDKDREAPSSSKSFSNS